MIFAGDSEQCFICRERNALFLEKYVGLQIPRRTIFTFQLFIPTESLSTSGKTSLERDWGGSKCSVWKNPSYMSLYSHKSQNTSLHEFKTCSKNHKLQLCCAVRKEQEGPKAC